MIRVGVVGRTWPARVAWALGFWVALVALTWLDAHAGLGVQRADVFTAIWAALVAVGDFLSTVGGYIATSLEGVVGYLVTAVSWLAGRVGSILVSTGSMFAKAWDGLKIVWSDVVKPALVWVDQQLTRLQAWLKDTFRPVFAFLSRIRDEVLAVYKHFVQPIVDTIEFIRQLNRVLLAFHINVLQGLDRTLQQIEQRIEEPILWINAKLNEIWHALELVVGADGLFQRLTLVRSMSKYAPNWMNGFWNRQIDPTAQSGDDYSRTREYPKDETWANGKELAQFYRGDDNRMQVYVDALLPIWRQAAGVDPPSFTDNVSGF